MNKLFYLMWINYYGNKTCYSNNKQENLVGDINENRNRKFNYS